MAAITDTWTYQDLVEHVLDVFDSERAGRPLRMARRSIVESMRTLQTSHAWSCYSGTQLLKTTAPYSTGTIGYDHTGGTAERLVTLAAGTFPADALYSRIVIADVDYPIERYIDSTHITLTEAENPGADVTAGATYSMYRDTYALPVGLLTMGELWDMTNDRELIVLFADQCTTDSVSNHGTPATPEQALVTGDPKIINRLALVFMPPPEAAVLYRFGYQRQPRPLFTEKFSTGLVTVGAGSTTCTIATGLFTQAHVGCIIRFGSAANEPDGFFGGISDTENQFSEQRFILSVASNGLTCVLDSALSAAVTSVKFTVSDPVDVETGVMLTALQRGAEASYAILTKRESKDRLERLSLAQAALLDAKDGDRRIDQIVTEDDYTSLINDVEVMGTP